MVYIIIYYNIKIFAFGKEGDVGVDIASVTLETEGWVHSLLDVVFHTVSSVVYCMFWQMH